MRSKNFVKKGQHSHRSQHGHQRKRSGGGVPAINHFSVAVLATPTLNRRRKTGYPALLDDDDNKAEDLLMHSLKSGLESSIN